MAIGRCHESNYIVIDLQYAAAKIDTRRRLIILLPFYDISYNRPVLHSERHQRPARERHKIRIASLENVDNQAPRNANYTLARFSLLLNVDITILYPNTQTLTFYMYTDRFTS